MGDKICPEKINHAVYDGIRKTINRFRENPFLFFTESDIHASLSKDIMAGHSDLFILRKKFSEQSDKTFAISLVHHEYPTNFRYQSKKLKEEGYSNEEQELTNLNSKHGDRGNLDLAIINPDFLDDVFRKHADNLEEALKEVINKDNERAKIRNTVKEVLFAVEVKFLHPFNAGNKGMIDEVKKDNNKLDLALRCSDNFIKPINLVFCNTDYKQSNGNSVIDNINDYLRNFTPKGVCAVFIQSYYKENVKITDKPIIYYNPIDANDIWVDEFRGKLKI